MAQGPDLVQTNDPSSSSDESSSSSSTSCFTSFSSFSSESLDQEPQASVRSFLVIIEEYSDLQFKKHFRLERRTVLYLISLYKNSIHCQPGGRPRLSPEKEIYMFIWYLSNSETFREISNLFGVTRSTAWKVVLRVSQWLLGISHEYIKWPSPSEAQEISSEFEKKQKIQSVIGAIDGTHIQIKAPRENKTAFFNRKHYYSINLQVVVDARKRFISVSCGEPGSLHDSRVLRRSQLYKRADQNMTELFPNNSFLIGDSAYPLLEWLVPPFRDNGSLSDIQTSFNFKHSSTRIVVEHAIGLLKARFRRLLHFTEQVYIKNVKDLVACACILHNICMQQNDILNRQNEDVVHPAIDENAAVQEHEEYGETNRRQRLVCELVRRRVL